MSQDRMPVGIKAIEYYLPTRKEVGADLVHENPDWRIADIEKKTGVKTRFISAPEETAVDMAEQAANKLFSGNVRRHEIDFLIFVTQSPDYLVPTSACILQHRLALSPSCMAFDINLGCSGFIYGLAIAGSLIQSGLAQQGLLLCGDTYTKFIGATDRTCRPLFSDAAVATLIQKTDRALLGPFELGTDGSGSHDLIVTGSALRNADAQHVAQRSLFMNGSKVYIFTLDAVPKCVNALLTKAHMQIKDIDLFVFHQASKLVMDAIIRRLSLPEEKVYCNYARIGNTVSASIPIALNDAAREGRLHVGDRVMLVGFGVGYSWGGCIIEWNNIL